MAKIGTWSTTPASNNSTPPDGWPEGQAPSTVNDCAREMMAALRTALQDIQWFDHGFFPITVGSDAFTVTGDQSAFLKAGGKLKLYDGAATIYRSIATVSASATTLVTMKAGTGVDASLSSFAVGIISNANGAIPARFSTSSIEVTALTAGSLAVTTLGVTTISATVALLANTFISILTAQTATIVNLASNQIAAGTFTAGSGAIGGYLTIISSAPKLELNKPGFAAYMWHINAGNNACLVRSDGAGGTVGSQLVAADFNGNLLLLNNLTASAVYAANANFSTLTAGSATINNCFIGSGIITTLGVTTLSTNVALISNCFVSVLTAQTATVVNLAVTTTLSAGLVLAASMSATNVNIAGTFTVSSAVVTGQLRCKNGSTGSTSIAFDPSDLDTGPYWIGDGVMAIACNNTQALKISVGGVLAEAYVFGRTDADTGFYWVSDGLIQCVANSVEQFRIGGGVITFPDSMSVKIGTGSEGTPAITFSSTDNDTGPYWISDGVLGWACNGVQEARLLGTGFVCQAYTVTSDAATKKDWSPFSNDFVARLANMKAGSYTKIKDDSRALGIPAQDLQLLYPEAVHEENGVLLANYGPAAMVSAVALAKRCEEQDATIASLMARLDALEKKK